ncbi:serine carboxypeptidase-like 18 [Diospyros lotus]|uniref:serine carboxypeptidase-like 18 n=1 Tax=Diospyros lotus TaxID=55363 RepID=UPI00224D7215|nr:serine carboxypeptidase-like 18 [Diospyros lotus]
MALKSGCRVMNNLVHLLLLSVLGIVFGAKPALSGQIVQYLPGFDGELPFKLETGYINVDESELFYYFIESEGDPQGDPLFLWLTGGPGCTAFSGLIYEVGPMEYDVETYTGGLPKLRYYPYGWTKSASMIFLDSPVGTGFSYARTLEGWASSDMKSVEQAYQFLRKWLVEHPQYLAVQLYIAGDSYAGKIVPLITKKIMDGNKDKAEQFLNVKGYLVGSPRTDLLTEENSKVELFHRLALISDEIYENLKKSCNDSYVTVDPSNTQCLAALQDLKKCVKDLSTRDFLEPNCELSSNDLADVLDRRSVTEGSLDSEFLLPPMSMAAISYCTAFSITHNKIWANDESVQEALHVRKETVRHWERCNNSLLYTKDIKNVVPVHKELSGLDLEVLVESGDHDIAVPYIGTLKWIKSLNLSVVDGWRPWHVDNQVAGYTTKYSEKGYHLTFATVKGAGHPAPEFYRRECFYLFDRWIKHKTI